MIRNFDYVLQKPRRKPKSRVEALDVDSESGSSGVDPLEVTSNEELSNGDTEMVSSEVTVVMGATAEDTQMVDQELSSEVQTDKSAAEPEVVIVKHSIIIRTILNSSNSYRIYYLER